MKTTRNYLAIGLVVMSACARTVHVESGGEVAAGGVMPATSRVLPAGALFQVQLDQSLSAERNHIGDKFTAHVTDNVMAQDGSITIPEGAVVTGRVTGLEAPSNPTKPALVRVDFETLSFNGRNYPLHATVEETHVGGQSHKKLLKSAGIGAAAGGVLGVVIGHDVEGLFVGGALGAAAGTLISLGIDAAEARLPEGSRLTLMNDHHVTLH
jgi:hypothetical protein